MPKIVIGLDVSTSCTGICLINPEIKPDDSGSHILHLDHIEFKKFKTLWEKADYTSRYLSDIKTKFIGDYILAVEEPLMGFQKGMSSAATITTLMRFNLQEKCVALKCKELPSLACQEKSRSLNTCLNMTLNMLCGPRRRVARMRNGAEMPRMHM